MIADSWAIYASMRQPSHSDISLPSNRFLFFIHQNDSWLPADIIDKSSLKTFLIRSNHLTGCFVLWPFLSFLFWRIFICWLVCRQAIGFKYQGVSQVHVWQPLVSSVWKWAPSSIETAWLDGPVSLPCMRGWGMIYIKYLWNLMPLSCGRFRFMFSLLTVGTKYGGLEVFIDGNFSSKPWCFQRK